MAWWDELHTFQQVLFVIACATTLFMIVQIIMLAVGMGSHDASFDGDAGVDGDIDTDADLDGANDGGIGFTVFGLKILTVRSIVAFLAIGSWLTFALFYAIRFWSLIPGIAAGVAAAFLMALFFKAIGKLQNSGNLKVSNTVGKSAEVYLTIPPKRGASGKINVYVQERYVEIEAVTDSSEPIPTGATVRVVEVVGEGTVLVEPFASAGEDKANENKASGENTEAALEEQK